MRRVLLDCRELRGAELRKITEHVTQDRARRRIGLPITSEYDAIGSLFAKARTS